MRKYISFILSAIAAVLMTGCVDLAVTPIGPDSPAKVKLQLTNADLVATRAVTDDNQFNEDLIKSVQCFFAATNADAVTYATDIITLPDNTNQNAKLDIELPAEVITPLFGTSTSCDVYVVANYGSELTDKTITAIKAKTITLGTGATQESFVMDGKAVVSLNGTSLKGTVNLIRAAAKVIVKVNVENSVEEAGKTWTPGTAAIKMTYTGSVNGSKISADAVDADASTAVTYTQTTGVFTQDIEASTAAGKYVGYQATPFYSFPVSAEANKGEINMVIPWTPQGSESSIEYNYQIPIDIAFERNNVYVIEVNVGMLGTLDGAELTPSYIVVDWTENAITAGLSRPQYLVVDQNYVVMNNVEQYFVGYAASDDVILEITETSIKTVYSSENENYDAVFEDVSVETNGGNIVLTHDLDNTRTAATNDPATRYDYRAMTFKVKVTLKSNPSIYEEITFVQYPAMYLTTIKGNSSTNNNVMINANSEKSNGNWWHVYGTPTASPDVLTITVSSFDESTSNYIICDPREASNTANFQFYDGDGSWSEQMSAGTDASGDTNLTGYRGTITGDPAENLVAPSFMIASSCGSNREGDQTLNTATTARYRCAGYQENGYPAGRWRIPTPAELSVIGKLCAEGKIEAIFVNGATYMSSNGPYTYRDTGTFEKSGGTTSGTMRCVYDTWYWTDKCKNVSQFIWGAEGDIANGAKSAYLVSVE